MSNLNLNLFEGQRKSDKYAKTIHQSRYRNGCDSSIMQDVFYIPNGNSCYMLYVGGVAVMDRQGCVKMNKISIGILGVIIVAMMCINYGLDSRIAILAMIGIFGVTVTENKKG